jgi:hypothetical protein
MPQERREGAGRNHPAKEDLVRFMRGDLEPGKAAPIVRHLLAGCARCGGITRELWSLGDKVPGRAGLVRPIRRDRLMEVWL